jgi:glycosyltransferase involved in cell wall biosynthesis
VSSSWEATPKTVHLVEPGGRGGVFQHTVAVAEALAEVGVHVVLHTAQDAELRPAGVTFCPCVHWYRSLPHGLRQPLTAGRYLLRTVPHVLTATDPVTDVLHMQGLFGRFLYLPVLLGARRSRLRTVISPHNTFVRRGGRAASAAFRWSLRAATAIVVFSDDDLARLAALGLDAHRATLTLHLERPDPAATAAWRQRYGSGPIALLAGQVRADKRPDVFIEACRLAGVTPAIVGEALDGEPLVRAAASTTERLVRVDGYLPGGEFAAAVAAADVVVAPYAVGSVSGPLACAADLGVRSVAFAVGGLGENVTVCVDPGRGAAGLADGIRDALRVPAPPPRADAAPVADEHLRIYRSTAAARS